MARITIPSNLPKKFLEDSTNEIVIKGDKGELYLVVKLKKIAR